MSIFLEFAGFCIENSIGSKERVEFGFVGAGELLMDEMEDAGWQLVRDRVDRGSGAMAIVVAALLIIGGGHFEKCSGIFWGHPWKMDRVQ